MFVYGQDWQWKSYTSVQGIKSLSFIDSTLWCATEGGLATYNPFTQHQAQWTNTEGLAGNDIRAIDSEGDTAIWLGFDNGCIQRYDLKNNAWMTIREYENQSIQCLYIHGDSLFVGLDIGLSIYLIPKSEVKETYKRLGKGFQVELAVQDIMVHQNEVYAATQEGIAKGQLGNVNLLDPENWQNIRTEDGLPGVECLSLALWKNEIFAATSGGLSVLNDTAWTLISPNVYTDLYSWQDELYAAGGNLLHKWDGNYYQQIGPSISADVVLVNDTFIAIGNTVGISLLNTNNQWESISFNSMAISRATALDVNQGILWVCSGTEGHGGGRGIFRLEGEEWFIYNRDNLDSLTSNESYSVAVDKQNNTWIGTWGDGIVKFGQDSSVTYYNARNGYLSTSDPNNPYYPVITDMFCDNYGTMWICNYQSMTSQPVVSVTEDGVWTYYGYSDGITSNSVDRITVDDFGIVWIGTRQSGIYLIDTNYTPSDKSDDEVYRRDTSHGLESNVIKALLSTDTGVWVGTPEGLQLVMNYSPGIPEYGLYSSNIAALAMDGVGNLWAGTKSGISVKLNSESSWINFTAENSDIISNDVLSIAADDESGYIYVGTTSGVSKLSTPFLRPVDKIQALKIYPSPFKPSIHKQVIIDNLTWNVSVNIFTPSGLLVKSLNNHLDANGRQLTWDGKDENDVSVPSGVYLVVMNNEDGKKQIGKIALIR